MTIEFVTVAESSFAPHLLNLYRSLERVSPDFHLTVACADQELVGLIQRLGLERASMLDVSRAPFPELDVARSTRGVGEYCWTLTPYLPRLAFHHRSIDRVTYVDADMWFLRDPAPALREFEESGAGCMITPHAYSPHWDATRESGYFCVQFLPVKKGIADDIMSRWGEQCAEYCSLEPTSGGLGDQAYLSDWPTEYGARVKVVSTPQWFQGPWNCDRFPYSEAISYHFHGLRIRSKGRAWLGTNPVPKPTLRNVYVPYLQELRRSVNTLNNLGYATRYWDHPMGVQQRVASVLSRLKRSVDAVRPSRSATF